MKRLVPFLVVGAGLVALSGAACRVGSDAPVGGTPTPTVVGTAIALTDPTVTASGLQYVDEVVGTGRTPAMADTVQVHYVGKLASNGAVFDSSVARGEPATFQMAGVIQGFSEALLTMQEGGKRTAYLPAALAYGERGQPPDIPPNADLVFEIELISVQ